MKCYQRIITTIFILILTINATSVSRAVGNDKSKLDKKADENNFLYPDPIILPIPGYEFGVPNFANLTKIQYVAPISNEQIQARTKSKRYNIVGYIFQTNNVLSVVTPTAISQRQRLKNTLRQAKDNNCIAAINGGPYNSDGTSSGPLVIQGRRVAKDGNSSTHVTTGTTNFVGFGTTQNQQWLMGSFDQFDAGAVNMWNFVTGFGWLVYNGENVAKNTENPTGADIAARTAIGLDRNSNILFVVIDGCERCSRNPGVTLEEIGSILVNLGAWYAINLDGGGSSTMVVDMKVVNQPTCLDVPFIVCQRPVATVVCVKSTRYPW